MQDVLGLEPHYLPCEVVAVRGGGELIPHTQLGAGDALQLEERRERPLGASRQEVARLLVVLMLGSQRGGEEPFVAVAQRSPDREVLIARIVGDEAQRERSRSALR